MVRVTSTKPVHCCRPHMDKHGTTTMQLHSSRCHITSVVTAAVTFAVTCVHVRGLQAFSMKSAFLRQYRLQWCLQRRPQCLVQNVDSDVRMNVCSDVCRDICSDICRDVCSDVCRDVPFDVSVTSVVTSAVTCAMKCRDFCIRLQ